MNPELPQPEPRAPEAEPSARPSHGPGRWRWLLPALGAVLLTTPACKSFLSGESAEPDYATDTKTNMDRGNEALESHNYVEAEKYFEYVRQKFPYSTAARDAELRLGDSSFAKEEFTEARDRYTNFVKLHPTNPKVDYAAYRASVSHYQEFRKSSTDFFLFPPSYEKDQGELKTAVQSIAEFIQAYPSSTYVAPAQKILDDAKRRLANHEMYVAAFYAKRERWLAAANRWEGVVSHYPKLGADKEAAFKLTDAYRNHLHDPAKAQAALRTVIERYPNTPDAQRAQKLLGP